MIKTINLECSLKPFKKVDDDSIHQVAREIFEGWKPFIKHIPTISIMLWAADGSEILDYNKDLNTPLEWGRYAGSCNTISTIWFPKRDPNREGIHSRSYKYIDEPATITYLTLKNIIRILKEEGKNVLGEGHTILVGETFDPGPEFANSTFKYVRHPEINGSGDAKTMSNFACANTTLHADTTSYAAYPNGIPEGTPFGTFLGKQSQIFLTDMGFDFLWLSNGFGFGKETWSTTGAIFDGKEFHHENITEVKDAVFSFWNYFRAECPNIPIQTRGTNMSVGIDYSKDGVPLYDIYHGNFNVLPPPNSPWAALDGDFGLEIMGYLSRIADLPENGDYLFRYYIHDPWWVNSPWYDRYQGQPHDIYMPLSCARINEKGEIKGPSHMSILSIDNTYGNMPENCINEPLPHILRALKETPTECAPVVWVYPFKEYSSSDDASEMKRMFSGDWFVRGAINHGFPLTMVVSTDNFQKTDKTIYSSSVLFTPVPNAHSDFEKAILSYIKNGGKVLFYGSTLDASKEFLDVCGIENSKDSATGDLPLTLRGKEVGVFKHSDLIGAGPISTKARAAKVLANTGDYALLTKKENVVWVRGDVSSDYVEGVRLLVPQDEHQYYVTENLALEALKEFGWALDFQKDVGVRSPMLLYSRYDNALMLSAYLPSTTIKSSLKTPLGAPIFIGYETKIENNRATYYFPKSEHRECRFFVDDTEDGILSCKELPPVSFIYRRRIGLYGLKDATVRVLGENYCKDDLYFCLNGVIDEYTVSDPFEATYKCDDKGCYYELQHVTGDLVVSMKRPDFKPQPLSKEDSIINTCEGVPNYL